MLENENKSSLVRCLTLIKKIENYRMKYYKDPKVFLFDFPRASDMKKILAATSLMEDAKSGYLETTFGGNHKEIQIGDIHIISNSCPYLYVLSVDHWRLWTLSGKDYGYVTWPIDVKPRNMTDETSYIRNEQIIKINGLKNRYVTDGNIWTIDETIFNSSTRLFLVINLKTRAIVGYIFFKNYLNDEILIELYEKIINQAPANKPNIIHSDNDPTFSSSKVIKYLSDNRFQRILISIL